MMPQVWCLLYVLILLTVGFAATAVALGSTSRRSIPEICGLTLLLGTGLTGTLLTWLSMLGLRPTRGVVVSAGMVAALTIVAMGRARRLPLPTLPRFDRNTRHELAAIPLIAALLAANAVMTIVSLAFPFFEWDATILWAFKAKILFGESLLSRPIIYSDPAYSFIHADYPLLLPMLMAGAYGMVGQIIEPIGKVALPLLFAGQTLLAYVGARRWLQRPGALLIACLMVCAPFNFQFAGLGNADSPLQTFYLGSIVYLLRWIDLRERRDIVLSALFCVFLANTKSEGLPIALINAAMLLAAVIASTNRRAWIDWAVFVSIFALGAGVWWVWRTGIPHTIDDYASQLRWLILAQNIGRLTTIIPALAGESLNFSRFGLLWLLLPFTAIIGFKAFARPAAWVLWTLLLAHISLYILIYVITHWDVKELLSVTQGRLLLHAAPAAMLLLALHWSASRDILLLANEPQSPAK